MNSERIFSSNPNGAVMSYQNRDMTVLAALFLWELSIMAITLALYMKGERPFAVFLSGKPGIAFLCAIATCIVAVWIILRHYWASRSSRSRHFSLLVATNILTVVLILVTCEIAIRILSRSSIEGEMFGTSVLMPKNWDKVALYHRQLLDQGSDALAMIVYDDLMGWTIGPSKKLSYENIFYWSSSEGVRAPREGITFAESGGKTRIALVGDSFTFGANVAYEDTWGYQLEKEFREVQVLNFGVMAYGIDQAYLRYEKDARKWNPQIVIFGVISHDFERTMNVYPWISYITWTAPYSKPRFILLDGEITRLNVPPLAPGAVFSHKSITELPFLEYDRGYRQRDWQKSLYHVSYLARLLTSKFPRWTKDNPDVSDEALVSVNASILKAFVQSATENGAIPLIVYFPYKGELNNPSSRQPMGKQVLQHAGIAYTDATPCLLELNSADRFIPGGHYTPQGYAAVAKCLRNPVRQALAQASVR